MTREPWSIHFFQRHPDDDPNRTVPAIEFFDRLPAKLVAEFQAVLDAVAEAPPPAFSGGGKWEAMHDKMADFYGQALEPSRTRSEPRLDSARPKGQTSDCIFRRSRPDQMAVWLHGDFRGGVGFGYGAAVLARGTLRMCSRSRQRSGRSV
ncbi:MAG: hypothetical protein U0Q03_12060, partial [Acidimicrobiales bacterium]